MDLSAKWAKTDFQAVTADVPQVGHNHTRDTANEAEIQEPPQLVPTYTRNEWESPAADGASTGQSRETSAVAHFFTATAAV